MCCLLSFLPATESTAMGVTAERYGRGGVEAVPKEASLRNGDYSMCSQFWLCLSGPQIGKSVIMLILRKCPPVLHSAPPR